MKVILKEINKFNGTPLNITSYKTLSSKAQNKVKEIFENKGWKMSIKTVHDQRDGNYTDIVLEVK